MPFRLTKQIRDVFEPIGPSGTFETVMVHCMRAFRENSKLLLNTMDIFVKEPALNWMVMIERQFENLSIAVYNELHFSKKLNDNFYCRIRHQAKLWTI